MPDSPDSRKRIGAKGEAIARTHLEGLGWRILVANYRCSAGEMDLIAEENRALDPVLVFIEVKTRIGRSHGSPAEAVDARKRRKLIAVAQHYLAERDAGGQEPACRFDIVEVVIAPGSLARVALHRAAFMEE